MFEIDNSNLKFDSSDKILYMNIKTNTTAEIIISQLLQYEKISFTCVLLRIREASSEFTGTIAKRVTKGIIPETKNNIKPISLSCKLSFKFGTLL